MTSSESRKPRFRRPNCSVVSYRYSVLLAAVLTQGCLGATYSWAVFVPEIRSLIAGLHQSTAQIPYFAFYTVFPATAIFAGPLLARLGTRSCALLGGLVFGAGWILAGFGERNFIFTVVGIGVLGGIGVGMTYMVPMTVCVRWFPERAGLVTGIAVAGFGGGAAHLSPHCNGSE